MSETFATDDSLKNFTITTLAIVGGSLQITYTVSTRLNEVIPNKVIV